MSEKNMLGKKDLKTIIKVLSRLMIERKDKVERIQSSGFTKPKSTRFTFSGSQRQVTSQNSRIDTDLLLCKNGEVYFSIAGLPLSPVVYTINQLDDLIKFLSFCRKRMEKEIKSFNVDELIESGIDDEYSEKKAS